MLLSSNMVSFHNVFGIRKTFDLFAEAGVEAMDFNLDAKEYRLGGFDEEFYRSLAEYARSKGVAIGQAHAPFASSYPSEADSEERFLEIVESIKRAAYLGAPMIVVHPCMHLDCSVEGNYDRLFDYNLNFYRKLAPYAGEAGVKIAIENIHLSPITATPEAHIRLFDALSDPVFTVCFDVGHSNIAGCDPAEAIRKLGSRLANGCLHVHDNLGDADSHTLPFYGNIDWDSVMRALAEIGYEGNFNYEAAGFIRNVPVDFRPEGLKYMASVGHYLVNRFLHYKSEFSQK